MILDMFKPIWLLLLDNIECNFYPRCLKRCHYSTMLWYFVLIYCTKKRKISRWKCKSTHFRIGFRYSLTFIFSLFVGLLLRIARWKSQNPLKVSKLRQNMQKFMVHILSSWALAKTWLQNLANSDFKPTRVLIAMWPISFPDWADKSIACNCVARRSVTANVSIADG